ncbi:MAG: BMP family ABC transporter substrate-binding protein [Thermostichales cyanobacterium BF4_bins_65]
MLKGSLLALGVVMLGAGVASAQVRVGLAFDAGGKNDRSFNESAWNGAQLAQDKLKVRVFDFEPTDPAQVGQGIRQFAQEGFDLIVGVGFANEPAITSTANEFTDVKFAVIDSVSEAPNVASLIFREQEGSFLVGYIAGKTTQTGVVGFMGGMDIPLIHKFEAGYRAGVNYACQEDKITCRVLVNYVGTTPAAWNDPAKAREIAAAQKAQGADIIYAAAGGSGLGVIDFVNQTRCLTANNLPSGVNFIRDPFAGVPKSPDYSRTCTPQDRPMFFIGVDANQNYLGDTDNNPKTLNHGLTSMLKRVDVATFAVIEAVANNQFQGGVQEFSLANQGVGFALDEFNQDLISAPILEGLKRVSEKIISGSLQVPEER